MLPLLTSLFALAAPDPAALSRDWSARAAAMTQQAWRPVALSAAQLGVLAAGDVVRAREQLEGADRVLGAIWSSHPRDHLWIAILDDKHDTLVRDLFEQQLPGTVPQRKLLYQRLDLPWPFDDRQWVIEIRNNPSLWAATDGLIWERTWRLADPGLAISATPDALWTPVNEGGWTLVDAAGGTIVLYHARTVVGGAIPDDAVASYAMAKLEEMMRHVVSRAASLGDHYGPDHERLYRPDGSAI